MFGREANVITLRLAASYLTEPNLSPVVGTVWCGREDSNFHGVSPTATSTLRVYQFRHDRMPTHRQGAALSKSGVPYQARWTRSPQPRRWASRPAQSSGAAA